MIRLICEQQPGRESASLDMDFNLYSAVLILGQKMSCIAILYVNTSLLKLKVL